MPEHDEFSAVALHFALEREQLGQALFGRLALVECQRNIHRDQWFFAQGERAAGEEVEHGKFMAGAAAEAVGVGVAEGAVPGEAGRFPAAPGERCGETQVVVAAAVDGLAGQAAQRGELAVELRVVVVGFVRRVEADVVAAATRLRMKAWSRG
jgi:hypothetical protein